MCGGGHVGAQQVFVFFSCAIGRPRARSWEGTAVALPRTGPEPRDTLSHTSRRGGGTTQLRQQLELSDQNKLKDGFI